VKYPDEYNQDISMNKAVHVYFAQAIPLITYIDDSCLYLKEKKCRICEAVCKNNAIDLNMVAVKEDINVGAIILSQGIEPYDPILKKEYRYEQYENVVTSGCCALQGLSQAKYFALQT
jgi:heterodisulfide reductase subunit A